MIGVYFESWGCPWTNKAEESMLAKIASPIEVVYLSFVRPDICYVKGQYTFANTGLDFSLDFSVVKKAIQILQQKKIKVMIAVGGATFPWDTYKPQNLSDFVFDIGADGIDIDWEPAKGIQSAAQLPVLIQTTRSYNPTKLISLAGFSTGCFEPNGDTFRGMNIAGLTQQGQNLDWVNIMAYDAGQGFDVIACYESYRKYFKKELCVGFQVGQQGWGDAMLTLDDVVKVCNYIKGNKDGCFVWAYFKSGNPTTKQVLDKASSILSAPTTKPISKCACPNCGYILTIQ